MKEVGKNFGKKKTIGSLRSDKGVSVTSTKGKLYMSYKSIIRTWVG